MTELEIMQHAKIYIDKMANGINPLTDQAVSENDVVNNVRISRCLFYVSDILRQIIENDGVVKKPAKSREKFYITDEQKLLLQTKENNCYVRDISEEINRVTENNATRKLQAAWITNWLVNIGMLEIIDGKKHATEQGKQLGITTELRNSYQHGEYFVNIYSPSAQVFIFDNIDAVLSYRDSLKEAK